MKFGFYSPYLDTFGGGERYMLTLASFLSKNNDVDIFWDDMQIKAPLSRFLKIDLSQLKFSKNIFKDKFIPKISSTLSYDCIFVLSDGSIPISFARNNILHFQVPFIFNHINLLSKLKLKKYQHVVCNSNFTKNFIDKTFKINSKVIYPPVDINGFKPEKKQNIILSVGRFSPNQLHPKKQEVLIEVFKELYKKEPNFRLVLVGQVKKEDYSYFRKLKKNTRGHAIKIIDNLPIDKLRSLFQKSLIYWHATGFGEDELKNPQKMEHFGISTVEASAAGAVPIVINKGGQKEIIQDSKNGLLWSTKTELLEKTLKVIQESNLAHKLSQNAVNNSKRFSKENFIKEYEKLIF